ncbi:MAG: response regulator [Beijerinckiaceae bacterium]|nr:response regulator [Beijerinckiaceae bacterium]
MPSFKVFLAKSFHWLRSWPMLWLAAAAPFALGVLAILTLGDISRGLGAAMAVFLVALAAVTGVHALTRRALLSELARLRRRLDVAEQKYARILKFNAADFIDKADLLELTLNHMNQGVAVIRPDGRVWLYNKRSLEYSGVAEDELPFPPTAKSVVQAQLRNQEFGPDGDLLPPDVRAFLMEGKGRPPKSYTRTRPNGTVLEIRSDPMPDGSLIQTYTDITELARAKEAAEAAARAKASFLATMSHEIRTPISGVIGAARLLSASGLDEEQRRYLETISACSESLLVVINDILDYSRFDSAGVTIEEAPCDPAAILRSAFLVTRPEAAAKGLRFEIEGLEDLPPAMLADAKRLRQALINYLGNAVKFTQAGAVTMRAQKIENVSGPMLRVTVADTGIGVPASAFDRLFQEFSQVDSSITRKYGGSGLGLAITRRIAHAMGGQVGMRSEPGCGSAFWIEIPLKEATLAAPPAAQAAPAHPRRSLRILVAEDVPTNQLIMGATLRSLGHSPFIVPDGLQALAQLESASYDLVVLDMHMPAMDGLEAARRIRAMGLDAARLPIIAITANGFASDREACLAAGMDGFISKPFEPHDIENEIARLTRARSFSADAEHSSSPVNTLERNPAAECLSDSEARAA